MLFLGVDGGGTSTRALIADERGRVLGTGTAGPSDHIRTEGGRERFLAAVEGSVGEAWRAASGQGRPCFRAACLGFCGGTAGKEPLVREILDAENLAVATDAAIALAGATGGEPGVATIAGTGSIAFGRNAAGRTARAGGWGCIFGDEGGALDIVRQALRAALRFEEGWGPETALRGALLEATGAHDANDLLHRFYTTDYSRTRIAALAPLVDQLAEKQDPVAAAVIERAGADLAAYSLAVWRRLFAPGDRTVMAHVGGAFRSRLLREAYAGALGLECEPARLSPAEGALLEAYRAAGIAAQIQR
jgi:N-acetylglucosamine kinase-like BadF-type ATPase